jgi:formimidoylglutamate deiminase
MADGVIRRYQIAHLWTPAGWLSPGFLEIDEAETIAAIAAARPPAWADGEIASLDGFVIPGMPNLHSHAHQRGLAGRAEGTGEAGSFWGWRSLMYQFVDRLSPDDLEVIAAQAYVEMLEAGFTTVGEFHYLHHDRDGSPYTNPTELSERIIAAAEDTGVALTLLPSLYTHGGIGEPAKPEQRRFVHQLEPFLRLVETLLEREATLPWLRVGVAPHSLRAVSAADLTELVAVVRRWRPEMTIHLHAAEQVAEVTECVDKLGAPPVCWLLDHLPVDERWTLIHATHADATELRKLASRGAVVGLCPITEANLGDGIFPLVDYHRAGGRWGIGTDSNIAIDLADELRLLEYGQRLIRQRRDVLVTAGDATTAHPGRLLYDRAAAWGAQSLAQPAGTIEVGKRADLVELDSNAVALVGHTPQTVMDGWLFGSGQGVVRTVIVGGRTVVQEGRHIRGEEIARRYAQRMRALALTATRSAGTRLSRARERVC